MKNNKTIVGIIAIAIIALTTFIAVSCNKDTTATHEVNTTPAMPQTKTFNMPPQLKAALIPCWQMCDYAYQADSVTFLRICNNGNKDSLIFITGVTPTMLSNIANIVTTYVLPMYDMTIPAGIHCEACLMTTLANSIRSIRYNLDEMDLQEVEYHLKDFFVLRDDFAECIIECLNNNYDPFDIHFCWFNCLMEGVDLTVAEYAQSVIIN